MIRRLLRFAALVTAIGVIGGVGYLIRDVLQAQEIRDLKDQNRLERKSSADQIAKFQEQLRVQDASFHAKPEPRWIPWQEEDVVSGKEGQVPHWSDWLLGQINNQCAPSDESGIETSVEPIGDIAKHDYKVRVKCRVDHSKAVWRLADSKAAQDRKYPVGDVKYVGVIIGGAGYQTHAWITTLPSPPK